jgi:citrate synthase
MTLTIDKEVRKPVPRIAYPGLKGLPVVETAVSEVLGDTGVLHYRGIRIEELVSDYTFEQVWSWLWDARIESADVAALTDSVLRSAAVDRTLAEAVALGSHSDEAEPWGAASSRLRSAISMASAFRGMRPLLDTSAAERRADALTICAQARNSPRWPRVTGPVTVRCLAVPRRPQREKQQTKQAMEPATRPNGGSPGGTCVRCVPARRPPKRPGRSTGT